MKVVFLATRISGTDGVSLEAERWRDILQRMGHEVVFVAGQLDRSGVVIPELYFQWKQLGDINNQVVYNGKDFKNYEAKVYEIAGRIEGKLRESLKSLGKIDLIIVPNALSLPWHVLSALPIARTIEELDIPTIARHHDFWWERDRYLKSSMRPFFEKWFPPDLPNVKHVVINSLAQKQLKKKTGLDSEVIWDTFNFDSNLNKPDSFSKKWRKDFRIGDDDIVFLQATRLVPRKRIEMSMDLIKKLDNPRAVLVIAGYAGDEGKDYEKFLKSYCRRLQIRCKFIGKNVNSRRRLKKINGGTGKRRVYTLWDCFDNADFVTYPTEVEGFGNQYVESVYFRKPVIITPYPVYLKDIKPLGFSSVEMPGKVTKKAINEVNELINEKSKREIIQERNFNLGKKYFSYDWVEGKLNKLFKEMKLS